MLSVLTRFVDELRAVGVPVSMVETLDAGRSLAHVDLGSRPALKAALGATLVKSGRHTARFEETFDAFFAEIGAVPGSEEDEALAVAASGVITGAIGSSGSSSDDLDLEAALRLAIVGGNDRLLGAVARVGVDRFAGIEPGRPVGGAYYFYRVMRGLGLKSLESELLTDEDRTDSVRARIERAALERRLEELRDAVRDELRRRLVRDRGGAALARVLRRPLIEDVDLTAASREELLEIERVIRPLARRLATRISMRRHASARGRLDVRRTMRASLSTGGVPVDPRFRRRHPGKPEIVILCDVSGSVASFARFTLQLVYSIASQFSRVRTFAFIDGIDEVTSMLGPTTDFATALQRIGSEAQVVSLDGHSDYGGVFDAFVERYLDDVITPRSTVVVTGDARTNYHDPRSASLGTIAARARSVAWLNPEPARFWDTGDSAMGEYAPVCDLVAEVRTLRHLERFVEHVALPSSGGVLRSMGQ